MSVSTRVENEQDHIWFHKKSDEISRCIIPAFALVHVGVLGFPGGSVQETQEMLNWSLGQEDPLEEEMALHSSILAWEIPWIEEPGRLQSMGSKRARYNWVCMHAGALVAGKHLAYLRGYS